MLKSLVSWSADNRQLVILVTLLVAAVSIWAMVNTSVDAIPDLSDVQVIIKTDFPGQGPQIVEEQITYPLSTALLAVPLAKTVRGYSMFGTSFVYLIFKDGTDMYWARSRVLEYLNYVSGQLPPGVVPTIGPDATGVGWVFQYSVVDTTGTHDLAQLRSIQDFFLKFELQAVEGVAEVATVGGFQKQYQVVVDPQKLSAFDIPLSLVKSQIQASNRDVGGRVVELGEREFIVRGRGYLRGMEDIRSVPLKVSGSGSAVTVGDIATVQLGPELRRGVADKNGEGEVVGGIVIIRYGENAARVIQRVKERLAELKSGLPAGVEVVTEYDRSMLIDRAVRTLSTKLLQELAVVALVVMLFLLHVRSAFVALVTVPVGILIALLMMYLLDINANIMSLGGIAIAIGVMVDASLVMVENAHKHIEREVARLGRPLANRERVNAVRAAAVEVGPSLFFSLLIVTVSFLPVFTLEQVEGRLFRPLALTKTFSMAAASILAVTLVPALMVVFVRGRIRTESQNPLARFFIGAYRPAIRFTMKHPVVVVSSAVVVMMLTMLPLQSLTFDEEYVPFPQIGSEFMPPLDEGDLLYMPTTLPGISVHKAKELLQQTDRIIASFPEVRSVFGKVGRAETATDPAPLSMIETVITLKPESEWRAGMTRRQLVRELDEAIQIPGLTNAWTMPIKTRIDMLSTGIKTPVGVKVAGEDLSTLERIGREIEAVIRGMDGTLSVYADRVMGGSYLDIDVDREKAGRYGLTTGDIQDVVASAVGGMTVTTTVEGLERYPVNIRYPRALRDNLPALRNVLVPTATGAQVPLGQLANISLLEGPPMIKSENARPNAWVYVDLDGSVDLGSYVRSAKELVAERVSLPPGYSIAWSGQYEYLERASERLRILVPITVAIVFLLLLILFKNITDVLVLMLMLPFAGVGATWLMSLLGFNMSIAVGVGLIAVVGLAAETGVVMLVYLREAIDRYRREGRLKSTGDLRAAIEEGSLLRVRPLLMTVITTLMGLTPIMFGTSTGSEVMKRIATPMVGGLFSATVLTLVVLPALYLLVQGRRLQFEVDGEMAVHSSAVAELEPVPEV